LLFAAGTAKRERVNSAAEPILDRAALWPAIDIYREYNISKFVIAMEGQKRGRSRIYLGSLASQQSQHSETVAGV
jgi:hypothetical protein